MKNQDNGNKVAVVIVRTCLHILEDVKSHCEASYSIDEKSDFSKGFKSGADLMKSTFLKRLERAERLIQDVGVLASCGLFEFPAEKKRRRGKHPHSQKHIRARHNLRRRCWRVI